jgi:plasmid stabilization system protein ParE
MGRPGRLPGTRELVIVGLRYIVAERTTAETVDILAILRAARRWPDRLG